MSGLYIHIPFCRKACIYCDFHFSTSLKLKEEMVTALSDEIDLRSDYLSNKQLSSLYFGGGTPSVLEEEEIELLLEKTKQHFELNKEAEITLEANPDDLGIEKLDVIKRVGINRLSIGIQSFDDKQLKFMNRTHTAEQSLWAVENVRKMGIENFSIDLIYGLPGMSVEEWKGQLKKALQLKPPHISAYALTVEPRTALSNWVKKGKITEGKDEIVASHFELTQEMLGESGYEQYEVSNFALKGKKAVHNSSYWEGEPYLGIGPSAHSFNGSSRQWNITNNHIYIRELSEGRLSAEKEMLSTKDLYNEMVMTSLRKREGLSLLSVRERFDEILWQHLLKESASLIEKGNLVEEKGYLYIPEKRRFYSDGIAAGLFYI